MRAQGHVHDALMRMLTPLQCSDVSPPRGLQSTGHPSATVHNAPASLLCSDNGNREGDLLGRRPESGHSHRYGICDVTLRGGNGGVVVGSSPRAVGGGGGAGGSSAGLGIFDQVHLMNCCVKTQCRPGPLHTDITGERGSFWGTSALYGT